MMAWQNLYNKQVLQRLVIPLIVVTQLLKRGSHRTLRRSPFRKLDPRIATTGPNADDGVLLEAAWRPFSGASHSTPKDP